jgi:hypothetical protein
MRLLVRIPRIALPRWGRWFSMFSPIRVADPSMDRMRACLLQKAMLNDDDTVEDRLDRLARVSKLEER